VSLRILAIETSSEACSVALAIEQEVYEHYQLAPREHTRLVLPMIKQSLDEHQLTFDDLDAIAFAAGPGAFTGLRIAAGVTQGLAYAAEKPVIKVSTLQILALQRALEHHAESTTQSSLPCYILTAIDARMNEVYWALFRYDAGVLTEVCNEQVCTPEQVDISSFLQSQQVDMSGSESKFPVLCAGSGWEFEDRMPNAVQAVVRLTKEDKIMLPRAGMVARLAIEKWNKKEIWSAEQAIPCYIRDRVTWKKLPGKE